MDSGQEKNHHKVSYYHFLFPISTLPIPSPGEVFPSTTESEGKKRRFFRVIDYPLLLYPSTGEENSLSKIL